MIKSALRTQIRMALDDVSATMWSNADLDVLTGLVIDEKWGDILEASPWYLSTLETITGTPKLVGPGYIDTTQLAQRFYKLQLLTREGRHYRAEHQFESLIESNTVLVGTDFTYRFYGSQLWLFPLSASDQIELRYSYKPALYTGLADNATVIWPDGFEMVLIYETAARALMKGAREDNTGFRSLALESWNRLIPHVRKRTLDPITPYDARHGVEYGGV